jgi:hypothetical protein
VASLQAPLALAAPPHDFRQVDSARRVRAALLEPLACEPGDSGWSLRREGRTVTLAALPAGEDISKLLPTVLPPIRLGRDDGFRERTVGLSVSDGWLVSRDAGEWGGALWFVGWDGKKKKLADQALLGFAETPLGLLALGGLPHHSRNAGALFKMVHQESGDWLAEPLAELPGEPLAWQITPEGALLVVTPRGGVELAKEGNLRELSCVPAAMPVQARSAVR